MVLIRLSLRAGSEYCTFEGWTRLPEKLLLPSLLLSNCILPMLMILRC